MGKIEELPPSSDKDFWQGDNKSVNVDSLPLATVPNSSWRRVGVYAICSGAGTESAIALDWRKYEIKDGRIVAR